MFAGAPVAQPAGEICASLLERIETRIAQGRPPRDVVSDGLDAVTSHDDRSRQVVRDHVDVTTPESNKAPSTLDVSNINHHRS